MSKLSAMFQRLKAERRAAFIPFFAAGDPDLETTKDLLRSAGKSGADAIEVGVPFSDPIADGPVIQAAFHRSLERGFQVAHVFDLAQRLRREGFETPLLCMVSYTLVFHRRAGIGPWALGFGGATGKAKPNAQSLMPKARDGVRTFLTLCKRAGYDGAIIPDLPAGYEGEASAVAAELGLDLIFLMAPTTTPERRELIIQRSRGFIYYVSVAGITGTNLEDSFRSQVSSFKLTAPAAQPETRNLKLETFFDGLALNVRSIKERTGTPVCVGFGIAQPEQAAAVAACADGVIVGSALVKKVDEAIARGLSGAALLQHVEPLLKAFADACHGKAQV